MAYTVTQLITNAYYLSGIRSAAIQGLSGDDIAVGLDQLNKILVGNAINTRMIPYYTMYEFPAIIGQEMYFVPHCVEPNTLTFNDGDIRYETLVIPRDSYHGSNRVDNVIALPFTCTFEKTVGGCNLFVFPLPALAYDFKIWGKYTPDTFTYAHLGDDISAAFDLFYIDYLEHYLAKRICNYNKTPFGQGVAAELAKLSSSLDDMNQMDLAPTKVNQYGGTMGGNIVTNAPQWNIGRGFMPPSSF